MSQSFGEAGLRQGKSQFIRNAQIQTGIVLPATGKGKVSSALKLLSFCDSQSFLTKLHRFKSVWFMKDKALQICMLVDGMKVKTP